MYALGTWFVLAYAAWAAASLFVPSLHGADSPLRAGLLILHLLGLAAVLTWPGAGSRGARLQAVLALGTAVLSLLSLPALPDWLFLPVSYLVCAGGYLLAVLPRRASPGETGRLTRHVGTTKGEA
jgi:hypothetical protein